MKRFKKILENFLEDFLTSLYNLFVSRERTLLFKILELLILMTNNLFLYINYIRRARNYCAAFFVASKFSKTVRMIVPSIVCTVETVDGRAVRKY